MGAAPSSSRAAGLPPRGTGILTVLVAGDPLGEPPLPLGVAVHARSTVVVCFNWLRLLPKSAWPPGSGAAEHPTV